MYYIYRNNLYRSAGSAVKGTLRLGKCSSETYLLGDTIYIDDYSVDPANNKGTLYVGDVVHLAENYWIAKNFINLSAKFRIQHINYEYDEVRLCELETNSKLTVSSKWIIKDSLPTIQQTSYHRRKRNQKLTF